MAGLSDMSASLFNNQMTMQGYARQEPQGDAVAGTRGGKSPEPQTGSTDPATLDTELSKYALSEEDKAKQAANKPIIDYQVKEQDLEQMTKAVASKVKIDDAKMQEALRGDPRAMQELLSGFGEQLIKQTLLASATTSTALTNLGADRSVTKAQEVRTIEGKRDSIINQATSQDERFQQPKVAKVLADTVASLQTDYPNAPVDLLTKRAISEVHELIGKPEAKRTNPSNSWESNEVDWTKEFSNSTNF